MRELVFGAAWIVRQQCCYWSGLLMHESAGRGREKREGGAYCVVALCAELNIFARPALLA